jgi:hypothetical protein
MNRLRIHKATRVRIAALAFAVLALLVPAGSVVQASGLDNCRDITGPSADIRGCYETVWMNGVQVHMTFYARNTQFPGSVPTDKMEPFYVLAPQTDTPQGIAPLHDHVISALPGQTGYTAILQGFFVLCSPAGLGSGDCVPSMTVVPGFGTFPFAKSVDGQQLTYSSRIEAAAQAGFVSLIPVGVVIGAVTGP